MRSLRESGHYVSGVSGVSLDRVSIGSIYRHVTTNRFTCPPERRDKRDSREPICFHVPPLEGKEHFCRWMDRLPNSSNR